MKESRLKVLFQHVPIYKKRNRKWEIQVFTYKQGLIEDQKYELKIQSSRWSMIYGTGISFKLIEINEIWFIYYRGFVSHWRTSFWSEERLENDGELMPCGRVFKNRGLLNTCQLFLRYKREIFIVRVLEFLKTTRSFPKIPEEVRRLPKTPKSAEGEVIESQS